PFRSRRPIARRRSWMPTARPFSPGCEDARAGNPTAEAPRRSGGFQVPAVAPEVREQDGSEGDAPEIDHDLPGHRSVHAHVHDVLQIVEDIHAAEVDDRTAGGDAPEQGPFAPPAQAFRSRQADDRQPPVGRGEGALEGEVALLLSGADLSAREEDRPVQDGHHGTQPEEGDHRAARSHRDPRRYPVARVLAWGVTAATRPASCACAGHPNDARAGGAVSRRRRPWIRISDVAIASASSLPRPSASSTAAIASRAAARDWQTSSMSQPA